MEQEEITKIYETLAPMAGDYANAQAEQIGQAQKSMGPLAANTMGTTTSGLGNYTYNRLMRPQVDTMRDEIMVQGYANQLNRLLSDKLREARNRYNRNTNGTGGNNNNDGTKSNTYNGDAEEEEKEESNPQGSGFDVNDYISETKFGAAGFGNLPGQTGKWPLSYDSPTKGSGAWEDFQYFYNDKIYAAEQWIKKLKGLGYAG